MDELGRLAEDPREFAFPLRRQRVLPFVRPSVPMSDAALKEAFVAHLLQRLVEIAELGRVSLGLQGLPKFVTVHLTVTDESDDDALQLALSRKPPPPDYR